MAWKLIEPPKTILLKAATAREFAEMETIPSDRPLSERRLMVYRRMLAEGRFRPVTWASCECDETGMIYRLNGKHTSLLLSQLNPLPEFYVTIERYRAATLADVTRLYATFDSQAQTRTARDVYLSFSGSMPELHDVPASLITAAAGAIPYATLQEKSWNLSAAERAEMLLDHAAFILWAHDLIHPAVMPSASRIFKRVPVMAAMLLTWLKDRRAASRFWTAVRDETGESPDLPDRRLGRWLMTMAVNRGQGGRMARARKADEREFFVKCLHAWNAWRKGQPHTLKYIASAELPRVV